MDINFIEIPENHICIDIDTEDGKGLHIHLKGKYEILEM